MTYEKSPHETKQQAREREYDERLAAQTKALDALGFGPAFDIGGGTMAFLGAFQAATCNLCGAMARTNAAAAHHRWHFPAPPPVEAAGEDAAVRA